MRRLPPNKAFEVKLSDEEDAAFEGAGFSCPSQPDVTATGLLAPAAPFNVKLHRTDPRANVRNEGGLCVCRFALVASPHQAQLVARGCIFQSLYAIRW